MSGVEFVKMLVLCENAEGAAEFHACEIPVTARQIESGEHYGLAETEAENNGYKPIKAFDQTDPAMKQMVSLAQWISGAPAPESTVVAKIDLSRLVEIGQDHLRSIGESVLRAGLYGGAEGNETLPEKKASLHALESALKTPGAFDYFELVASAKELAGRLRFAMEVDSLVDVAKARDVLKADQWPHTFVDGLSDANVRAEVLATGNGLRSKVGGVDNGLNAEIVGALERVERCLRCGVSDQERPVEGYASAEVHSDDRVYEAEFNAAIWLSKASEADVVALVKEEWRTCEIADRVAEAAERVSQGVSEVLNYTRQMHRAGHSIGFECSVSGVDAMAWLNRYRPEVAAAVVLEAYPEEFVDWVASSGATDIDAASSDRRLALAKEYSMSNYGIEPAVPKAAGHDNKSRG